MRNWYYSKYRKDVKALISHEEGSFDLIQSVVKEGEFKFMVELGSFYYGLTLLLHEANRKIPLFTFDSMDARMSLTRSKGRVTKADLEYLLMWGFGKRVTFIRGDIIDKKSIILMSLLPIPGKKLLYCDNGNKDREICYYGKLLNIGDVMGVHDWGYEVHPQDGSVKNVLDLFNGLPINHEFEKDGLTSRFFVKVK
jgi:hypothetical protein